LIAFVAWDLFFKNNYQLPLEERILEAHFLSGIQEQSQPLVWKSTTLNLANFEFLEQ
jgi:hypothetical protein